MGTDGRCSLCGYFFFDSHRECCTIVAAAAAAADAFVVAVAVVGVSILSQGAAVHDRSLSSLDPVFSVGVGAVTKQQIQPTYGELPNAAVAPVSAFRQLLLLL